MKRGCRDGNTLQYAAARAALWLLNDMPALVEAVLFPDHVRTPVRTAKQKALDAKQGLSEALPYEGLRRRSQIQADRWHPCLTRGFDHKIAAAVQEIADSAPVSLPCDSMSPLWLLDQSKRRKAADVHPAHDCRARRSLMQSWSWSAPFGPPRPPSADPSTPLMRLH